jgi:outer membrane protein assembly factor BamB
VPTVENHLLALSVEDGRRLWTYRAQPTTTMSLGLPAPAVEGELVVAGFGSGELAAIRAADGRPAWSETLASARGGGLADIAAIAAMPVIDRGRVFATGLGGLTVALDLRSGRRLWEREVTAVETPWSAGDALFLVSTTANSPASAARTGGCAGSRRSAGSRRAAAARPDLLGAAGAGGRAAAGAGRPRPHGGGEPAGRRAARHHAAAGGVVLQPAVAGSVLYLLTEDAEVVAMRGQG